MMNKTLQAKAALQIQKPAEEVYEAIVDPRKMTNYFISQSTGPMEEGKELFWKFPEFEEDFPVRVGKIEPGRYISYYWEYDGLEMMVEITLKAPDATSTVVSITEKERPLDDAGIKWLQTNTEGWANFLACLKAYLEHGINLRKGGFDFMKKQEMK